MTTPTTFTLANLSDLAGGAAQTASATPFTQSALSGSILCSVAAAASVVLTPSLYSAGNFTYVVDTAGFAGRPGAPITITVAGGGTINGLANAKITTPGGSLCLMFISGSVFQTVGHNP